MIKTLLYLTYFALGFVVSAQNTTIFSEANALYNESKYEEAISKYEDILDTKVHSAALYFNLGNAHYKSNHIAQSIFYYKKALRLSPNDKSIKNNLSFAQNMTIDAIENVPEVGFSKLSSKIINSTSTKNWAIIAIVGAMHFVFLFLLYHFSQATTKKRLAFIISLISLFVAIIALVLAFQKQYLDAKDNPAIVFAKETAVKVQPKAASESVFNLHEGTEVQVIETYNNWAKIQLVDNSEGWLRTIEIRTIKD